MGSDIIIVSEYNSNGNLVSDKKYFLGTNPITYEQYKLANHSPFAHTTYHHKGVITQIYRSLNLKQQEGSNGTSKG